MHRSHNHFHQQFKFHLFRMTGFRSIVIRFFPVCQFILTTERHSVLSLIPARFPFDKVAASHWAGWRSVGRSAVAVRDFDGFNSSVEIFPIPIDSLPGPSWRAFQWVHDAWSKGKIFTRNPIPASDGNCVSAAFFITVAHSGEWSYRTSQCFSKSLKFKQLYHNYILNNLSSIGCISKHCHKLPIWR